MKPKFHDNKLQSSYLNYGTILDQTTGQVKLIVICLRPE
jgi:hypothetical protein